MSYTFSKDDIAQTLTDHVGFMPTMNWRLSMIGMSFNYPVRFARVGEPILKEDQFWDSHTKRWLAYNLAGVELSGFIPSVKKQELV